MDGNGQVPADALNMSLEDIQRVIGGLTMHNIALQNEVARLKAQIYASDIDKAVLDSGVRGN